MGKQVRKVEQSYEVCDWCSREIRPIYDHKLMSLWPLMSVEVPNGGVLNKAKWLLANWSIESGEPQYMVHAKCAHKMISWAMHQKTLGGPERLEQWGAKL